MRGLYIRRRKSSRNSEYSVPDQSLMYEWFRKAKIDLALNFCRIHEQAKKIPNHETTWRQTSKGCETWWERERDKNDGYYYDANILLWCFKMAHGTLGMLDAIVTFSDGADLDPTHRQPLFSISCAWNMHKLPRKHTEQPKTQLGSVSFVDAIIIMMTLF